MILKEHSPNADDLFLRQAAIRKTNAAEFRNTKYVEVMENKFWSEFNERYGVFSVTANPANIDMWNEYSENFNGYCIDFDSRIIFKYFGGGGKVHYPLTLPILTRMIAIFIKWQQYPSINCRNMNLKTSVD